MTIKLELPKVVDLKPRLTVIGVGGAGGNAVNNMIASGLAGVEFVVANTDAQSLANSSAEQRLQLGTNLTEGLGAGARPEIGRAAAEEALEDIRAKVAGSHMVFIAAGMGGGTGTGAAAVIARIARESGALTVAVVTKPFQFEGTRRMRSAESGIAALKPNVDTMIVIPNQNLFRIANERTTFADAFVLADQVLYSGIACIVDLIIKDGLINLDFADVRAVMEGMGTAMMGTGEAAGENRAVLAAEEAISNPLLDDMSLRGAKGLLLSITGGRDMTLFEVDEAANRVREEVDPDANIIVGATFDDSVGDRIRVSIVASGMDKSFDDKTFEATTSAHQAPPSSPGRPAATPHAATNAWGQPQVAAPYDQRQAEQAAQGQPQVEQLGGPPPLTQLSTLTFPPATSQLAPSPQLHPPVLPREAAPSATGDRPHDDRKHDELTRALAEAIGAASHDDGQQSYMEAPPHDARLSLPRQQWTSSSGASFEDAPPRVSSESPPARHADSTASTAVTPSATPTDGTFVAQPPVEVRRLLRRLPEMEDFPAVGQREYRAKAEQYAGTSAPSHGQQPNAAPLAKVVEPPRKLGFFERLTGAKRQMPDPAPRTEGYPRPATQSPRAGNGRNAASRPRDGTDGNER